MEKHINELEYEEIKELIINNNDLNRLFFEDFLESVTYWVHDDVLRFFENVHGVDYEIGYCGSWFTVSECGYTDFIKACVNIIDSGFCLFSDRVAGLVRRAYDRLDFWEWCDIDSVSENTYFSFYKWFKGIIDAAISEILEFCRFEYDRVDDIDELTEYVSGNADGFDILINTETWTGEEIIKKRYA